jgi:hypothetical protein
VTGRQFYHLPYFCIKIRAHLKCLREWEPSTLGKVECVVDEACSVRDRQDGVIIKQKLAKSLPILSRVVDSIVAVLAHVELHPLRLSWNRTENKEYRNAFNLDARLKTFINFLL